MYLVVEMSVLSLYSVSVLDNCSISTNYSVTPSEEAQHEVNNTPAYDAFLLQGKIEKSHDKERENKYSSPRCKC